MPNKPDKFGIKFWLASDVKSKYLINGFPYLGKDESRDFETSLSEFVVLKLAKPFLGCGRNITTDNFFTSVPLLRNLLEKKTTLIGTIRSNKRELPLLAKAKKDKMNLLQTTLFKSSNSTLTIYKSKPNKKVLILSSKHKSVNIEKNKKQTPETITYYNNTKFGVDVLDQMAKKYTVKASSRRWPMQVFYNILDLAAINSWILYKETTQIKISRKDFIFQLAEELRDYAIKKVEIVPDKPNFERSSKSRRNCQVQAFCNRNRSTETCKKCRKSVCNKCMKITEVECMNCHL
jgi:uncharacterized ubiquitin-like protein YukD